MLKFLKQFLKEPRTIGAIAPSGRFLARKMMIPIDFENATCIVEYGPGLGAFSRELVRRKKKSTKLILIEQSESFCKVLQEEFEGEEGVKIICGDASKVNEYLEEECVREANYIISGLPFTSLPKEVSKKILEETKNAIGEKGWFITFQYSKVKFNFFKEYFHLKNCIRELKNLPPAYVLVMKNK